MVNDSLTMYVRVVATRKQMATKSKQDAKPRIPLSKDRVLRAAVELADKTGIETLTMRNLAHDLGVEAMSLYYHVANKEEMLDGMVEAIIGEIGEVAGGFERLAEGTDWKTAMRHRILSAREVMTRHQWAPGVLETRTTMSPSLLHYFDSLLGVFVHGGFSYDLAHHAMHTLGSRALGFNQELFVPDDQGPTDDENEAMLAEMASQLPFLTGMMMEIVHDDPDSTLGWCDDQTEFTFGLDLILNGLDALRDS